jgi:hypothetical protein
MTLTILMKIIKYIVAQGAKESTVLKNLCQLMGVLRNLAILFRHRLSLVRQDKKGS